MNYSPITFKVTQPSLKYITQQSRPNLNPNDYTLIKNHGFITLNDASDYYKCKKTGRVCRISFINNTIVYFNARSIDELIKGFYTLKTN